MDKIAHQLGTVPVLLDGGGVGGDAVHRHIRTVVELMDLVPLNVRSVGGGSQRGVISRPGKFGAVGYGLACETRNGKRGGRSVEGVLVSPYVRRCAPCRLGNVLGRGG